MILPGAGPVIVPLHRVVYREVDRFASLRHCTGPSSMQSRAATSLDLARKCLGRSIAE